MKPGRELDKAVAEAMGWTEVSPNPDYPKLARDDLEGFVPRDLSGFRLRVPNYSTDIAAAMKAWEWLEQNHPWAPSNLMLGKGELWDEAGCKSTYYCVFIANGMWEADEWESPHLTPVSKGETYPHAIALAVLATREAANETKS